MHLYVHYISLSLSLPPSLPPLSPSLSLPPSPLSLPPPPSPPLPLPLTLKNGDSFIAVTELMCSFTLVKRSSHPLISLHLF